ncbi:MAG TPA: ATP-dependent DNA helicase [Oxalicibacterium sp.]|nr:ATP-dependent DNA helicase [Oxalicibacterium sp.]
MSYVVAVRALCEFTARQGDLDLRFTPSPTALDGIAGHATVAARRPKHYESEVTLHGEYKNLQLRGRADGYDPKRNRVEEIKTFRGDFHAIPDNHRHLHWAQVKIYGWLLCQARGLQEIELALVYFDIASQKETLLTETHGAVALQAHFEQQCERFLAWAEQESAHRTARDAALSQLSFPHQAFRPGQRYLAESVYKSAVSGRCLLAQAPTGIGKTIATIFPLLKASPAQGIDKIFFLAAKTSGRRLALDAIDLLRQSGERLPLRVLELSSRDKTCEHPDKACHGESCPLAKGFYDRLPQARQAAADAGAMDQASLRTIALSHQVCPYYLGQELARWSDIVVGDYNYYFDVSAMLYALTVDQQWRIGLLVDEAHNMIDRARKMYSAELDQTRFRFARRAAPKELKGVLDRVHRLWNALHAEQQNDYQVYLALDSKFLFALQQACAEITDMMAMHPDGLHEDVQAFYFDALHFTRLAESFGEHSLFDISLQAESGNRPSSLLCLRNVVPAPFLQPRFAAAHTSTLFSATLSPWHFHADTLGLPDNTVTIDVESPFEAQQLQVRIARHISTRYQHRARSLQPIAELMAEQYRQRPGNYLAFFSSFDYLQKAWQSFSERHPDVPTWQQSRGMDESARSAFLERFSAAGRGIGFAVLGGAFAEGIDLPGDRLIGAFVATLGLPQINPVNEQMRQRMEVIFGAGYDYTYLYPGLQKVVQAAGRVIRTQQDRGVIHLIDDRYANDKVLSLLPNWWQLDR